MAVESWTLIFSLLFIQQESGTVPKIEHMPPILGIESEKLCTAAKNAMIDEYEGEATEPMADYEAPKDQPDKEQPIDEQFHLMRPIGVCIRVK